MALPETSEYASFYGKYDGALCLTTTSSRRCDQN